MTREQFHDLLERFLNNECTAEEDALVNSWYQLLDDPGLAAITPTELALVETRLWNKIQSSTTGNIPAVTGEKSKLFSIIRIRVAAALLAAAVVAVIVFINVGKPSGEKHTDLFYPETKELAVKENLSDSTLNFLLQDGTGVVLQPGAILKYPAFFTGKKREVYLQGEAFFTVAKNAHQPFYVYTSGIVTHVLGTSFRIRPNSITNQVEVEVTTGRVEVYENKKISDADIKKRKSNGVILTANQKVIYSGNIQKFETSLVENPVVIVTPKGQPYQNKMVFADASLTDVFNTLQSMYGIEIVTSNAAINQCSFTGDISGLGLYKMLDVICLSINAVYEIKETKILIKGNGCL